MNSAATTQGHGLPDTTISRILEIFSAYPAIKSVTVFGSRAKDNYRPGSDIDLCLDAPGLDPSTQMKIETILDDLLLPWKINLLCRHKINNPALLEHIARVSIPLDK